MQLLPVRRFGLTLLVLAVCALLPYAAMAHHGWGGPRTKFEITGKITKVRLGNPHGEVTIDVDGKQWVIEVGQPWRNERAGLRDDMFGVGRLITVHGHRSAKRDELLVKAERVVIDGKSYNLYPDRES